MKKVMLMGLTTLSLLFLSGCEKDNPTSSDNSMNSSEFTQSDLYGKWVSVGEGFIEYYDLDSLVSDYSAWDASENGYANALFIEFSETEALYYRNNSEDDTYETDSDTYEVIGDTVYYNPSTNNVKISPTRISNDTLYTVFRRLGYEEAFDSLDVIYSYVKYSEAFPPTSWTSN